MDAYRAEEGRPPRRCSCGKDTIALLLVAGVILLLGGFLALVTVDNKQPLYSVAIAAVSGLDPTTDLGRPALDPVFTLTLRIAARSVLSGSECFEPGTVVEVTYRGAPLAIAPVPQLCAAPWKEREQSVVAWGTGVRVPGFALDSLTADMRRGVDVFDVMIQVPSAHRNGHEGTMVSCRARKVGDATALQAPCDVSNVDTVVPLPQPGKEQAGGAN